VASISIDTNISDIKGKEYTIIGDYEILVDEEIDEYLIKESKKNN